MEIKQIKISHISFCFFYSLFTYLACNLINLNKLIKWFYWGEKIDYSGFLAFALIGFFVSFAFFLLIFTRKTSKILAILFLFLSCTATYFINKYDVAIDRSMIMNTIYTDPNEVHSLLSIHMISYFVFLFILPSLLIIFSKITFQRNYFLHSLKFILVALLLSVTMIYTKFDSISRAGNLSRKYIIHSLVPMNYIRSSISAIQRSISDKFEKNDDDSYQMKGQIKSQKDLIVVLAIGETSRQKNFSLYGYKGNETNPNLSKYSDLKILNGKAKIGSTLYALPEILTKNNIKLPALTFNSGVKTACYANYTLYDNCKKPGEIRVKNCGHNDVCFDEDVIPLLKEDLNNYKSGKELIILHLGGGSHGPSYHERYPQEFRKFRPICMDADVVNRCSKEELFNAYDNTILYVDFVLDGIIKTLEAAKKPYVLIYVSDHGESLLENDRIFHGMPPGISLPSEQSDVPLLVKSSMPIKIKKREEYSQNDIFDTILNLLTISSKISEKERGFIEAKGE